MVLTVTKPTVGGSEDSWGTTINTALDDIVLEINSNADGTNAITPNLTEGSWEISTTPVTASAAELNTLDGNTAATSTTVVDADRVVFNDDGTMQQVAMSDIKTYMAVPEALTDLGITDGTSGQFLTTDGAGSFSFASVSSGGGIALTDLSVGSEGSASGNGSLSYNSSNGEFTYTPPTASGIGALSSVPTSYGAVGTYVVAGIDTTTAFDAGDTVSGSSLKPMGFGYTTAMTDDLRYGYNSSTYFIRGNTALSGQWRWMADTSNMTASARWGLAVRIS